MLLKHFKETISWWDNRIEIIEVVTDNHEEYKVK